MQISVALGGGGIKGVAHIGVLSCLEQAGFVIRAVAGTSAGGLVGACYAAGYTPTEIQEIIQNINQDRLFGRLPADGPSLLGYQGLAAALAEIYGETTFADLKIPFACTAVDLHTAQEIYLNEGRLVDAVLATIAVPGIFPPRPRGPFELVDGGVLDPVPVSLARCLAPHLPVVAVALNPARAEWGHLPQFNPLPTGALPLPPPLVDGIARLRVAQSFRIFLQSLDITTRLVTELRLEIDRPEVIIRPGVHQYGMLDRVAPSLLYDAGYAAAECALPRIRRATSWPSRLLRRLSRPAPRAHPPPGVPHERP